MHLIYSQIIEPNQILDLLKRLSANSVWDGTLAQASNSTHMRFTIGIGTPLKAFNVQAQTTLQEMERFCFADNLPTIGFLSYDYGLVLKGMYSSKPHLFPYGHLKKYTTYAFYDQGRLRILSVDSTFDAAALFKNESIASSLKQFKKHPFIKSSFNKASYMQSIEQILHFIRTGYTFQLNLSIQFQARAEGIQAPSVFLDLFEHYPATHYSYFETQGYKIVSTSPESFLSVVNGHIRTCPIKGTQKVGPSVEVSKAILEASEKEDEELSMIVDLVRNDIAYHADYGSVEVVKHKSIFQVDNLLQMYSEITGKLRSTSTVLSLLIDAFPGGSITGFPKLEAMKIIDQLEPHTRNIYCGSLFVIYGPKDLEASIAIRTGYFDDQRQTFTFYAGSGITNRSIPSAEYQETLDKAHKFFSLFQ
jgi:para-aminobenzoate synthetase component 1